jgi:hypothetical protein
MGCGYYTTCPGTSFLSSLFDNPAASFKRSVALRTRLTTGLPLSQSTQEGDASAHVQDDTSGGFVSRAGL